MDATGWITLAAAVVLVVAALKVAHTRARQTHLERLWAAATAPAELSTDASPREGDQTEGEIGLPRLGGAGPDVGGAAAVPAANAMWQWTQIDPQFLEAVDFSHTAEVGSRLDLMNLLADRYTDLEGASHTGAITRLKGYLFEEQAHDYLFELHGDSLIRPETSNHPGYDFEVDGEQFDAKATDQLSNVNTSDPDVTYLVSNDAAGNAGENITFLEGLTNESVRETVEAHLAVASGDAMLEAAGAQLPGAAALLATVREWGAVRRGKSVSAAVEHWLLDTVGRGGGASGGLYVGGAVGSIAGPPGMAVGAVLGAASGALVGGLVATPLKRRKLYFAKRRLDRQLATLGQKVREQLDAFEQALRTQADEAQSRLEQFEATATSIQRSWRWKLWPNFMQVTAVAATDVARQDVEELRGRANRSVEALHATADQGDRSLALLATECPALTELAAVDVDDQLESIATTRDEVEKAVRDLALSKRDRDGDG